MKVVRWLEGCLLTGLTVLLFLYPSDCARGVRDGLSLCRDLLIPALFPFFVLSSLLIATGWARQLAAPLGKVTRPWLGVGTAGTVSLLLGLVGGYPVGLRTLAELRARGGCSPREARRAALFCNNCGPAFFIGAAGAGVFGTRQAGVLLLVANTLAALVLALALRVGFEPADGEADRDVPPEISSLAEAFPGCVSGGFSSTLGVCGYVILFSVLAALAERTGVLALCQAILSKVFPGPGGEVLSGSLAVGLLEISTGVASLKESAGAPAALPLAAFLLGWGGLSVHGQSLPFLRQAGGRAGPYLLAKLGQGLLSAGITVLLLRVFPFSLPAMAPLGPLLSPTLPGREVTALWALSGLAFFRFRRKRGGKTERKRV